MIGKDAVDTALTLVRHGYNIIPVTSSKSPIGVDSYTQYYSEHITEDFASGILKKVAGKASGIALLGSVNPLYPDKILVIIDIDNPWVWEDALSKLPEDLRKKLEGNPWKWLTGPRCPVDREKHDIKCSGDTCAHRDHVFKLSEAKRGLAYAILVPKECLTIRQGHASFLGGAVELRIRNYEVIPPSLHPSGVRYEWATKGPIREGLVVLPTELTCDEWRQLLVDVLGYGKTETKIIQVGGLGKRTCTNEVIITEDALAKAVERFKEVYIPEFRDKTLFGLIGSMWHRCVSYESAKRFVEMLLSWSTQVYPKEEVNQRLYLVDWVYGIKGGKGEERRIWGKPKLYETLVEVYRYKGFSESEARARANILINDLFNILGIKHPVRRLVVISNKGKISGKNGEAYVANDPKWGIIILYKRYPTRNDLIQHARRICRDEEDNGKNEGDNENNNENGYRSIRECVEEKLSSEEFVEEATRALIDYGNDIIVRGWYIRKARIIEDPYTGNDYYSIELRNIKTHKSIKLNYVLLDDLSRLLIRKLGAPMSEQQVKVLVNTLLVELATKKKHPVLTGIIFDQKEQKAKIVAYGRFRQSMKELRAIEGDAKAFLEMMRRFYGNKPKAWDAYAVGLFQVFNFLRKQAMGGISRNKALVLVGDPNTGKSTIAKNIVATIFNHPGMVEGPSILYSPARLARMAGLSTVPLLVNDVKTFTDTRIADMLKNLLTDNVPIYEVAIPYSQTLSAYYGTAGLIITAQKFVVTDIGVLDRLHVITFTSEDRKDPKKDRAIIDEFNNWRIEHAKDLAAFGRLYLETAVNEWDKVKDIILNQDYIQAARDYLAYIVKKLDPSIDPRFVEETESEGEEEEEEKMWHVTQFVNSIRDVIAKMSHLLSTRDKSTYGMFLELATSKHLVGLVTPVTDEQGRVVGLKFKPSYVREYVKEVQNLKVLYEGIRSELANAIPCINVHIKYGRDQNTTYLYISDVLMQYILEEIGTVPCGGGEGNENKGNNANYGETQEY